MPERRGAVVVGASSGLGRAFVEELAKLGTPTVAASPDPVDNDALAAHQKITHGTLVKPITFDLLWGHRAAVDFVQECKAAIGEIDTLVLTAAIISDNDEGLAAASVAEAIVSVNTLGPIYVMTEFAREFESAERGTLVAFSSIAAPVPRKKNLAYAASKMGLEVHCRGLRHHLSRTPVRVQVYRLGYLDTTMATGRTKLFPKTDPTVAARHMIGQLGRNFGVSYYPRYWQLVVTMLRLLPWSVFRRLEF